MRYYIIFKEKIMATLMKTMSQITKLFGKPSNISFRVKKMHHSKTILVEKDEFKNDDA